MSETNQTVKLRSFREHPFAGLLLTDLIIKFRFLDIDGEISRRPIAFSSFVVKLSTVSTKQC